MSFGLSTSPFLHKTHTIFYFHSKEVYFADVWATHIFFCVFGPKSWPISSRVALET